MSIKRFAARILKRCLTPLSISSSEQYSKGTPLKLYHVAVMTSAGPLFSADVMSEMIKDIADAVEQAKAKGLTK